MTQKIKSKGLTGVLLAGMLAASLSSVAQRPSVTADPELGTIVMTNQTGFVVDANAIQADQIINLRIPVLNDGHGMALPAGSCKIKIGLGSKLVLDPQYNINNTALSNYFKWTVAENSGQSQITGELIAPLPANVTAVNVALKVKASLEGASTITANFLITNHGNGAILSDEDGANNNASLAYKVVGKVSQLGNDGKLVLSVYPNPAKDVRAVTIKVDNGELNGKYNITLTDMAGKLVQTSQVELNVVSSFQYNLGSIAAGKYIIKVAKEDATQTALLKFERL
jgi:hypothetical protein